MAIRLIDRYPSRANPATTQYPHGSGRNKSDPTADDGTPFDQDRFNDQEAFFQGLLTYAGITPSGTVDTVKQSDYLDAFVAIALSGQSASDSGADAYQVDFGSDVEDGQVRRVDFGSVNDTATPTLENTGGTPAAQTITTRDGSALWEGALSGPHTLQLASGGGSWLVLDPNPIDGNQPASVDFVRAMSTESRLPFGTFTKHEAFGLTDTLQDGTIVHFYREADEHGLSETSVLRFVKSTDGGVTWTAPVTILSETDRDIRNYGGGVTDNDTIVVFTQATRATGTTGFEYETRVLRSTDGGDTFSEQTISESDTNNLTPYGKLVVTDTNIIQTMHRNPSNAFVIATSTDDGVNWSITVVETSFPGTAVFTEPTAVYLGSGRVACVARDNSADNAPALYLRSSDSGGVWSSVFQLDHVAMGRNPPMLWFNEDTQIVSLVWPSRGSSRMSDGGTGKLWPFYVAYTDADALWNNTAGGSFRRPMALPIYGPAFVDGNTGGDQGYQHFVETKYGTQMIYYKGNADPNAATDFFRANMTVLADGLF